jgi:hypothetical protein
VRCAGPGPSVFRHGAPHWHLCLVTHAPGGEAQLPTASCAPVLPAQVRRHELEEERRAADERKRNKEEAKQAERRGKYELSLQREEDRKQVGAACGARAADARSGNCLLP